MQINTDMNPETEVETLKTMAWKPTCKQQKHEICNL